MLYYSSYLKANKNSKCRIGTFQVSQVLLLVPGEVLEVPQQECLHYGERNVIRITLCEIVRYQLVISYSITEDPTIFVRGFLATHMAFPDRTSSAVLVQFCDWSIALNISQKHGMT